MFRRHNIKLCFLVAILATICYKEVFTSISYRDRVIGCLYSEVCSANQVCFDDNAFGRCEELDSTGKALSSGYVYQLDRKTLQLLEKELDRLGAEGFSWLSPYTQCVLKTVLNERPRIVYDQAACDYLRESGSGSSSDDGTGGNDELTKAAAVNAGQRPATATAAEVADDGDIDTRPLKTGEEFAPSPRPSSPSSVRSNSPSSSSKSGQASSSSPSSSSIISTDPLPSSAPRPHTATSSSGASASAAKSSSSSSTANNSSNNNKLADIKSKLRATHLKRTPTLWFDPSESIKRNNNNQRDSQFPDELLSVNEDGGDASEASDNNNNRQLDTIVQLLLDKLKTNQEEAEQQNRNGQDQQQQLDRSSEYEVLQAVPDQYLQYQSTADIIPYVTNALIDRKYDQQRQRQQPAEVRASVPAYLLPLYQATVPYQAASPSSSSHLSQLPRLKYPTTENDNDDVDDDLLLQSRLQQPQQQQPDDDDIYIVNAPLVSALLGAAGGRALPAQRPAIRVLRNTDEEQSDEDVLGPKDVDVEELVPVAPSPFDQDVIMVDVIDNGDDPSSAAAAAEQQDDASLIANILQSALQNGEDDEQLKREQDIAELLGSLPQRESPGDGSDESEDEADEEKIREDMKEMLLGDINYNNNWDTKAANFYRKHRYDIKKPGPKYYEEYFFKPDSEQQPQDSSDIATNYDEIMGSDGANKPSVAEEMEIEMSNGDDNDEDKSSNEPALLESARLNSLGDSLLSSQIQKKDKSIRSSKPVSEGPVKVDAKSENTIIIRSAEEGEETSLEAVDSTHTYVVTDQMLGEEDSQKFVQTLEQVFKLPRGTFSNLRKEDGQITFKVNPNYRDLNASQVASRIEDLASAIKKITGYNVKETGIGDKTKLPVVSATLIAQSNEKLVNLTLLIFSVVFAAISAAFVIFLFRRNGKFREKVKGFAKITDDWMSFDYKDLCRQRMQGKGGCSKEKEDQKHQCCSSSGSSESVGKLKNVDTNLANQHESDLQHTPPSRASTSSWVEEPVSSNMDITTGHIILSYMEDHLKKKDRLDREWEALCAYEADPCATNAAFQKQNANKNRYPDILAYDHSRVILNDLANANNSDYINANTITDHDPRNPAYIVTQGPLSNTKADFWQMIWEQGSATIVMLTRLRENGLSMSDRYWPEEGSEIYQNYEVHLVSEHIWCDDYLVRSFYLKNLKTSETRSVTQFHFLSWPEGGIPPNTKSILDFRRKVNKSYKGRSCPIVVHCSDGIGRTGTYILIDMVLNRLAKGAKEIDIAATLEHIRDQRAGMVKNKAQFEFVLLAVAEEVQAILKALAQN